MIALAYALGLVTPNLVDHLNKLSRKPETPVRVAPVVVVKSLFKPNIPITAQDVKVEHWPLEFIPDDSFEDPKKVIGQCLLKGIERGMPIRTRNLSPPVARNSSETRQIQTN